MTAYRMWTLTCDGCGEIWDHGVPVNLAHCKLQARQAGWRTGGNQHDVDLCRNCARSDSKGDSDED